jgi:hypothetical protein
MHVNAGRMRIEHRPNRRIKLTLIGLSRFFLDNSSGVRRIHRIRRIRRIRLVRVLLHGIPPGKIVGYWLIHNADVSTTYAVREDLVKFLLDGRGSCLPLSRSSETKLRTHVRSHLRI